jgi:hypothetical protein
LATSFGVRVFSVSHHPLAYDIVPMDRIIPQPRRELLCSEWETRIPKMMMMAVGKIISDDEKCAQHPCYDQDSNQSLIQSRSGAARFSDHDHLRSLSF